MAETARTIYDTHAAVRRLREAGLPEPHAEAVVREQVHLIEHDLATKADIAAVHGNIEAVQAALQADIEKLRLETRADIAKVQGNTEAAKADLVKWMVGTNIGIGALIVALIVAVLQLL